MARSRSAPELPDGAPANAVLADLAAASVWTGRPVGTLRRWIHEGRITRYGGERDCWLDLRELPEADSGQPIPARPEPSDTHHSHTL
jgi:hypothetical protein